MSGFLFFIMKFLIYYLKNIKNLDFILSGSAILLTLFGLISIFSSSGGIIHKEEPNSNYLLNFYKQIIFFVVGIFLMIFFTFFDWRIFKHDPYLLLTIYLLSNILLIGLIFFAQEIRGTKSWYQFGIFSFGPIEIIKISTLLILAKYFSQRHIELYDIRHIIISGIYVGIPSFLIFIQPDIGSVFLLISMWLGILIISGIKLRHFFILSIFFIFFIFFAWSFLLKDYQKERIISFFSEGKDYLGAGWNRNQAIIAIGSGGIFGRGIGGGTQTQYGFLPESKTDFIFAAIAEETGFIGVILLLFLLSLLLWRIFKIAQAADNNFVRLFAGGFGILLGIQSFVHIGMNVGILPIVGLPLPFVSYGGSELISFYITLGILQSMRMHYA